MGIILFCRMHFAGSWYPRKRYFVAHAEVAETVRCLVRLEYSVSLPQALCLFRADTRLLL